MSFIVTANPPAAPQEGTVSNDGFFPDMSPQAVRDACRLDGTVTKERLLPALQDAMLSVNAELQAWADEQRSRWGYATLDEVPAPQVGGTSAKVLYYQRAVHYCLMADLAEMYRSIASTPSGSGKADRVMEELVVQLGDHRRKQRWAISDLLGVARCTVELL
ncbi:MULTISPECIES: head completion/stabilization protein [Comamonas]|uniref:head completion/stabilization protein n=1 Tax=Comamonas TaxID=283 RepID=UPI0016118B39|nr:head completion/stabilization protein [Comamonas aquatica]MDE1554067.1 head completion/stabilization protein [Comamonas aquatica]MDH0380670.1 head completion/stabilization protein [Comamonas aquatica]MDH0429209.1 head completion/stabilization protein [Comamonas aquatica]MDH0940011.1 head completion/stabilization protein [Comamonas aquatica]